MPVKNPEWWNAAFYVFLSGIGGALGYIFRRLIASEKVSLGRVVTEGAGAAFVGYPVLMMCQALNLSLQWTGMVVSVCGWMGATATIGIIQKVMTKKLGVDNP